MKKTILSLVLILVLVLVAACTNTQKADEMTTPDKTDKMMDTSKDEMKDESKDNMMEDDKMKAESFKLMNLSGENVMLEDFNGQKVYIKFWASWCSICLAGLDEFDKLAAETESYKVISIVSPDFNGEKSAEAFKEWFTGLGYENIEVLLDQDGMIAKKYGVRAYPTSAYIDEEGNLLKVMPGHVSNDEIMKGFE